MLALLNSIAQAATPAAAYSLPPDLLAKARALASVRTALYFGGTAWTLAMLGVAVRGRLGWRIAAFADRLTRRETKGESAEIVSRPFLQGLIAAPLWLLALACIGLPVDALGHRAALAYHLSVEGWGAWLGDWTLSTGLTLVVGTLVLSALYALLRSRGRLAWFWFWLGTLPCVVAAVFATPLVIDPLFNHFTPLSVRDPALVGALQKVVARGGMAIPPERMFVMDASRRYTGMNAYVTGFGASKRVVVWDTTLPGGPSGHDPNAGDSADGLLAIYGHEQGHYVLNHIWKGMLWMSALLLVFYWIGFHLLMTIIRRRGYAWHIQESPGDWSSLGLLLWIALALNFLADPLANGFSRAMEHEADVYGQEVIHGLVADPSAVTSEDFNRLGRVWLETPEPNRFVVWWTYSHPPMVDRAGFAAGYDPWAPGRAPRYFSR